MNRKQDFLEMYHLDTTVNKQRNGFDTGGSNTIEEPIAKKYDRIGYQK